MDSILDSTKKYLGIDIENEAFDDQLIVCINTAFGMLREIGIGAEEGYTIDSKDNVWTEFLGGDVKLEPAKSYIQIKTRILFDPPMSSIVLESLNQMAKEIEWRLLLISDTNESS